MSKAAVMGLLTIFVAGGLLLLAPKLMLQLRRPAVEAKRLASERDESFQVDPDWLTEYELTERSGRRFHSSELAGKVHVVNFFFTACPTACPLQTQQVQELDREFGERGVHFLSISCDPERDTPATLKAYADRYQADPERWLFLTGDFDYTRRVAAEIYWTPLPQRMAHREELVAVDKWGKVRGSFKWNDPAEVTELRELLNQLLAETEPPAEQTPPAEASPPHDSLLDDTESSK